MSQKTIDMDEFIRVVYSRAPLWDQKDSNHHNRFVLDRLWAEVGREFKVSRNTARSKWKCLRDKFRTTLSKLQDRCPSEFSDSLDYYQTSWPQFRSLLFLKEQFISKRSRKPVSHSDSFQNPIKEENTLELFDPPLPLHVELSETPEQEPSPLLSNLPSPISQDGRMENHIGLDVGYIKRPRLSSNTEGYLPEKIFKIRDEEDEDISFFKSLLPHIKDFSSTEKLNFRINVMQIVQGIVAGKVKLSGHINSNDITNSKC